MTDLTCTVKWQKFYYSDDLLFTVTLLPFKILNGTSEFKFALLHSLEAHIPYILGMGMYLCITTFKVPDLHLVTGQHIHSGNTRILHKSKVKTGNCLPLSALPVQSSTTML